MTARYHRDLVQGTEEWLAARCGMLTASTMSRILTPKFKPANNDKVRAHLHTLLAQRITDHVEPEFVTAQMMRGQEDEPEARALYAEHFAPVEEVGFITNDRWGFTLGYSPDGLVEEDGLIECKSLLPRLQVAAIIEGKADPDHMVQMQTGLLVAERDWVDYVSYSGGLPMMTVRVFPDADIQAAIVEAAQVFYQWLDCAQAEYDFAASKNRNLVATKRRIVQELF